MLVGVQSVKILSGEQFSGILTIPNSSNIGISYISTIDNVSVDTKLELWIKSKINDDIWLPFYNPTKKANAYIELIKDKIIPCSPYTDGRGGNDIKFKINNTQSNDITLEVGLIKLLI
jgi:hypothetical protein